MTCFRPLFSDAKLSVNIVSFVSSCTDHVCPQFEHVSVLVFSEVRFTETKFHYYLQKLHIQLKTAHPGMQLLFNFRRIACSYCHVVLYSIIVGNDLCL